MNTNLPALILFLLLAFLYQCKPETPNERVTAESIRVRLAGEPDRLHPVLSRSSDAKDIENYLYWPLADYDPLALQLVPLLAQDVPEGIASTSTTGTKSITYSYAIRPEARWSDGVKITALDYLWTVKAALNPYLENNAWRGILSFIESVEINPDNTQELTVKINGDYPSPLELSCNFALLPAHHFDPDQILNNYSLDQLKSINITEQVDTALQYLAKQFGDVKYSRESLVTSGPYTLKEWSADQGITVIQPNNWWGNNIEESATQWEPVPKSVEYVIIKDETTALSSLRSGQLDIMSKISPQGFNQLRGMDSLSLDFKTPEVLQYYYIALNNRDPELNDKRVRRALAMAMDMDKMVEEAMYGLGQPITGPVHPSKEYYAGLKPLQRDIEGAKKLLADAGWVDTNNNGIVDKKINGKTEELSLEMLVSSRPLGQTLAILLKEQALPAGIEIDIVQKDNRLIRADRRKGTFELTPVGGRHGVQQFDPYQTWHTDNIETGSNYFGFGTEESDAVIEAIRAETDPEKLNSLYVRFQEIIYEEQPVLFLFAPLERIAISKKYKVNTSVYRPGFHLYGLQLN